MKSQVKQNQNNSPITKPLTYKDPKDVCIGIFLFFSGLLFFMTITYWLLWSKLFPVDETILNQFPYVIQFLAKDKHYSAVLITFLPILIIIFYFRLMAYNYFRHSF
jgi:hypothetical protein